MTTTERFGFAWTLSCVDGHDHVVSDEEFVRAYRDGSGLSEALCGHRVVPGPLFMPPGPRCAGCARVLHGRATLPDPELHLLDRRSARRATAFLRRLVRHCRRAMPFPTPSRRGQASPHHGGIAADVPTSTPERS
ncbi:hypothetical protein [Saccharopolyspora rosea]|uniref:hypothetical protein n=1 Tax=Saccharopolyspora rosea TaxID=524884 RepID=UPI0021DAA870|nr:hypothetical protein [Saccharopolyspora rosea]